MLLCPTHALFFFAQEESREAGEGERTSSWGCREGDDAVALELDRGCHNQLLHAR